MTLCVRAGRLIYQERNSMNPLPSKPRAGLYIDDSNLYKLGKASGWMTDYRKLYKWVAAQNDILRARVYMGHPNYEPAKTFAKAFEEYLTKIGFLVTSKELKKVRDDSERGFRHKCNFDVEMHDEVMKDLADLDIVYIATGDSDFLRTKENILNGGKHVKFVAYEYHCASEIRYASWYVSLDSIREEVQRSPKQKILP